MKTDSVKKQVTELKTLAKLRINAEINKIPLVVLQGMVSGKVPPVGDNFDFVLVTDFARIVYSIEEQRIGYYRHLSVSFPSIVSDNTKKDLLKFYKKELGFDLEKPIAHQWSEDTHFGEALNFLQITENG